MMKGWKMKACEIQLKKLPFYSTFFPLLNPHVIAVIPQDVFDYLEMILKILLAKYREAFMLSYITSTSINFN